MRRATDLSGARLLSACVVLLSAAGIVAAATAVPAWERTFTGESNQPFFAYPVAARELADGTRMVVTYDYGAFSAVRYGVDGAPLGSASFWPDFGTSVDPMEYSDYPAAGPVAIDAFGGVFVGAVAGLSSAPFYSRGDAWFMKFDGLTGRPAWPAPATWSTPSGRLAAPRRVFADARGDLVVSILAREDAGNPIDQVTLKYSGAGGELLWSPPPILNAARAAMALDGAGNVLVAVGQYANDYSTFIAAVKYAASNGAPMWGPVSFDTLASETPRAAAVAPNGDLVVTGQYAFESTTERGFQAFQLDGVTGGVKWGPARWRAPGNPYDAPPTALAVSPSGTVFVTGYVEDFDDLQATVAFSGTNGALLWGPVTQDLNQPLPAALLAAGNGDAVLCEYVSAPFSGFQLWTTRLRGSDGSPAWGPNPLDVSFNSFTPPIAALTSSGSILSADSIVDNNTASAVALERDGADGNVLWGPTPFSATLPGGAALNDAAIGPDGNPVVTGWARNAEGGLSWATFKYDAATGATLWGPVYFDTHDYGSQNPWQVETDFAGNAIVAGYVNVDPQNGDYRLAVVKYAGTTGAVLWTNAIVANFFPHGLAVDGAGNAVVLGQVYSGNGYDAAVVKLSAADGHTLWGPVLIDVYAEDYPSSVAVDGPGDVLVSGAAYDPFNGFERWFTAKLSSATGSVLWGPVVSGGAFEAPAWMAVDGSGDAIVTGFNEDQLYTARMMTVKYSGATGATLWGPVYYDSPAQYAGGLWVAADASGDVYSAGISWSLVGGVYNADFVTVKYDGSDGSVVWGPKLFDGPAGAYDLVYSVELDAAGNPVVAGNAQTAAHQFAFTALAYDGATGNVLWGPAYAARAADSDLNDMKVHGGTVYLAGAAERGYRTVALTRSFGIATSPEDLLPIDCGEGVATPLAAANGTPPYSWSLESGALPAGLTLQSDGSFGGTAGEEGSFAFRAKAQDSVGASASRDFTLDVHGGAFVTVDAAPAASCAVTLSVAGSWTAYEWLPGGETTPAITVTPTETTTYGVRLSDGSGCVVRGSITIPPTALTSPACLAPSVTAVSPSSGPSAGGTTITIDGAKFASGAGVFVGGAGASNVSIAPAQITADTPALPPGTVNGVLVVNPDLSSAYLARAFATDFLDIPPPDPFHDSVIAVLRNGVTAGCGGGNYCRDANVTRAQMAVFLLKGSLGSAYVPPPAAGIFADVPPGSFAADWIEDLFNRGITGGCATNPARYCPDFAVTRAQMAVFLLKAEHGSGYAPPACTGVFADVACSPNPSFAADWIEQLYAEGVTGGCAINPLRYCPSSPVTRGQMAVFLTRTFQLQ